MRKLSKALILILLCLRTSRGWLNGFYRKLDPAGRYSVWAHYAKIFRRRHPPVQAGTWAVDFLGRSLVVPLRSSSMWLDWDTALSLTGHELEVKLAYERALQSSEPPEIFLDVGSNYGTHALLMASRGVEVLAFEPLAECVSYGQHLAAANGVSFYCENVAIGDHAGRIKMVYPARETWLASGADVPPARPGLVKAEAVLRPLDDYAARIAGKRALIKIDVEGLEAAVLRGAGRILAEGPTLVFESWRDGIRDELWGLLTRHRFRTFALTLDGERELDRTGFLAAFETNFLATPVGRGKPS
jgi:FkbM family methyltransferase